MFGIFSGGSGRDTALPPSNMLDPSRRRSVDAATERPSSDHLHLPREAAAI